MALFFDSLINFVVPPQDPDGDEFYFQAAIYEADEVTVGMPLPVFSGVDDFNPSGSSSRRVVPRDTGSRDISWIHPVRVPYESRGI